MAKQILFILAVMLTGMLLISSEPVPYHRGQLDFTGKFKKLEWHKTEGESRICGVTPTYLPPTTIKTGERLRNLRDKMKERNLTAYMVPSEDAHQSEYIAEHDKRREYISGFSGSSGLVIVTSDEAALWTDSRYWLQADMELDCNWQLMKSGEPGVLRPEDWLVDTVNPGENVGYDATLMSVGDYNTYKTTFEAVVGGGPVLVDLSMDGNLVDDIWSTDTENPQPSYPDEPLMILDADKYTGETWQEKIWAFPGTGSIRGKLSEAGADALVVTKLDEIAWLFNLRGKDIPYNPMFVSYAIITTNTIQLYLYDMNTRLTNEIQTHLGIGMPGCENNDGDECVTVKNYDEFLADLTSLSRDMIWISDRSSYAVYNSVLEARRLVMASPILLMKAVKSDKEIAGMNNAHFKDSVALCQLGAWMQTTIDEMEDPINGDINVLSELIVEDKALEYRMGQEDFQGLSFRSISGFGPHAALNHYSSSEETDIPITTTSTFLFDSGSQYLDGSCDITRTFHFGTPTVFMREAYTRVLLGHIDLALGVFRNGIYGGNIDALAREPLWRGGLDYKHGTGHGIGHYLNIHEDPINIANYPGEEPIEINVCVSDEPGYYQDNEFGIRIEDIMCSIEADTEHQFSSYTYMTWRMASLVPLEPNLIDFDMFSPRQDTNTEKYRIKKDDGAHYQASSRMFDWYNTYNQRIREEVGPALLDLNDEEAAYQWMMSKTDPIHYVYNIGASNGSNEPNTGVIIGISVACGIVILVGLIVGIFSYSSGSRKGGYSV